MGALTPRKVREYHLVTDFRLGHERLKFLHEAIEHVITANPGGGPSGSLTSISPDAIPKGWWATIASSYSREGMVGLDDCTEENVCLRVIAQSYHERRMRDHQRDDGEDLVLNLKVVNAELDEARAVDVKLQAGQLMLLDAYMGHGSNLDHSPNPGQRLPSATCAGRRTSIRSASRPSLSGFCGVRIERDATTAASTTTEKREPKTRERLRQPPCRTADLI
jgi:hypothetical protein